MRRGALACALLPLAWLYGLLWRVRAGLHAGSRIPAYRAPVPVLVVGNVIAGGAGKTPVTLTLLAHVKEKGWRPGVVSRGYGRAAAGCEPVHPDSDPHRVGDEPLLIARQAGVPVQVASERAQAARELLARHPEVNLLVCDDGLQHLALARHLEVVVFDDRGTGNGWLLPAGPLREPWPRKAPSGVRQLVLHTGTRPQGLDSPEGFSARRILGAQAYDRHGRKLALDSLRGQRVGALAGIARPEAFFAMLGTQGITPATTLALPDHADMASIASTLRARLRDAPRWLCTEKDAVKLFPLLDDTDPEVLAVPLELQPEPAFLAAVDEALSSLRH